MVTQKGVAGLQKASRTRGENKLDFYPGQVLHTKCHHDYCNVYVIKRDLSTKREHGHLQRKQIFVLQLNLTLPMTAYFVGDLQETKERKAMFLFIKSAHRAARRTWKCCVCNEALETSGLKQ
ncbi:hypothetical protein PoB_004593100 [Plakobranchus ocellatus]|uniref:Uncharacterized protein n=1 Tax=Plakobranchus ocellatus TaxID=259542 RepID=A0AAV4BKB1_9GAST|nr:hypothetical protein PoB_004593100 [Plakobranchus ocellatus]